MTATAAAPQSLASTARLRALRLLSDERLAQRVAGGTQNAFAALYERHHQALYRHCLGILHNEEDAADCLQTTMLNAYRSLAASDGAEMNVKPWLFRIAHNESVSLLRRRHPSAELDEDGAENGHELALSPDAEAGARERLQQLVSDLQQLPVRQRGALVMRELGGLGFAEIGTALETSTGAAKQAVFEARSALHAQAEGREMSHEEVQRALSEGDGRRVRGRKLRAHLRGCEQCQGFRALLGQRESAIGAIAPLPIALAAKILSDLLSGGAGAGGIGALAAGGSQAGAGASGAGGEAARRRELRRRPQQARALAARARRARPPLRRQRPQRLAY